MMLALLGDVSRMSFFGRLKITENNLLFIQGDIGPE